VEIGEHLRRAASPATGERFSLGNLIERVTQYETVDHPAVGFDIGVVLEVNERRARAD
jgi:hypothetical protein